MNLMASSTHNDIAQPTGRAQFARVDCSGKLCASSAIGLDGVPDLSRGAIHVGPLCTCPRREKRGGSRILCSLCLLLLGAQRLQLKSELKVLVETRLRRVSAK
jgi:hypothetical protein